MTAIEALQQARNQGFDQDLQAAVLAAGDAELAYRFAHDVPGANLDALEAVVLAARDPRIVYDFALLKAEQGGEIVRLQARILASGDPGLMILFAADVPGADIEAFEAAIAQFPDPKYRQLFEAELQQKGLQ